MLNNALWSARGSCSTPSLVIGLARLLTIGGRANLDPQFRLLVALDGGLSGAAAFFAPDQRQLGADFGVLFLHEAERQHLALIEAVSGKHRRADNLAAAHDGVK